jgi:3-oxoadipate enol-lactonase
VTVVLSPSLGGDASMFEPQRNGGLEGHVVEHPGHGGTPVAPLATIRDLSLSALAGIDAERFAFVGVSLGGAVGMRIALDRPERVDSLALICTSARFGEPEAWRERAATVRQHGLEAIVDAVMERWFTPDFADVRRYREMFLTTDAEGYARCCDALASWDVRDEVHAIRARTLVISGSDDPSTPPEHGALLASLIRDARHVVIPGARHLANVDHAEEVNTLLKKHLA